MDFGSDGFLGVGPSEVVVICLVGYFLLGPTELYRLAKEVGKLVTQLRATATEASEAFSATMEDQLAINEIAKATGELQNAFSGVTNPLDFNARSQRMGVPPPPPPVLGSPEEEAAVAARAAEEEDRRRAEAVAARAEGGGSTEYPSELSAPEDGGGAQQSKFEEQLSGNWNDQVLAGQGPWTEADAAAVAKASATAPSEALFGEVRESAAAEMDDDVLELLGELEVSRLEETGRLRAEYEERLALAEERFQLEEKVVRDFVASKKAAVEKILRAKAAAAAAVAVGEAEEGTDTQAPPPALG